jgi:hypothetical protein
MFPDEDIETLRTTLPEYVNKMYEILDQTKDWPAVRELGGSWEYDDDTGSYRDTGAPLDIDVVDHLMAIRYLKDWSVRNKQVWKNKDVELNLEHALMLLTLGEAKANRPGVAIKAFYVGSSLRPEEGYRQFQKQIHGKRRGGRKSGTTKREENAERDEKMRADAVRRLKDRDDRIKIVQDLSEQHGITRDRVNQILRGTPGWPTRSRKSKRNHT